MVHRLWLLACVLFLGGVASPAVAQDDVDRPQLRFITELKQRNADYGPGCDGIGVSIPPAVAMPAELTSPWVASHSACLPGLRLVMTCLGDIVEADRVIGCTILAADGQGTGPIACDALTLILPNARFTPDLLLSELLSQGSDAGVQSCAAATELTPGVAIAAAFVVPASESATDLALLIDIDGSEAPAFLIPAGQLDATAAANP